MTDTEEYKGHSSKRAAADRHKKSMDIMTAAPKPPAPMPEVLKEQADVKPATA